MVYALRAFSIYFLTLLADYDNRDECSPLMLMRKKVDLCHSLSRALLQPFFTEPNFCHQQTLLGCGDEEKKREKKTFTICADQLCPFFMFDVCRFALVCCFVIAHRSPPHLAVEHYSLLVMGTMKGRWKKGKKQFLFCVLSDSSSGKYEFPLSS